MLRSINLHQVKRDHQKGGNTRRSCHRRHEPNLVAYKNLTKSSTFLMFVIKSVVAANILNFKEPLNN
jgi:hypothetical protein